MSGPSNPDPFAGVPELPSASKLRRKKAADTSQDAAKPARRVTVRRVILWGTIAILLVVAAVEYRAQSAYRSTLATCQTAIENIQNNKSNPGAGGKKMTFDDLKDSLPPNPVYTKEIHSFTPSGVYTWSWQGVRRYKVRLIVNPADGTIWDLKSEP